MLEFSPHVLRQWTPRTPFWTYTRGPAKWPRTGPRCARHVPCGRAARLQDRAHTLPAKWRVSSATVKFDGEYAFGWLRTEIGVHRLVRKSPFDSGKCVIVFRPDHVDVELQPGGTLTCIGPAALAGSTSTGPIGGAHHPIETASWCSARTTAVSTRTVAQGQALRAGGPEVPAAESGGGGRHQVRHRRIPARARSVTDQGPAQRGTATPKRYWTDTPSTPLSRPASRVAFKALSVRATPWAIS